MKHCIDYLSFTIPFDTENLEPHTMRRVASARAAHYLPETAGTEFERGVRSGLKATAKPFQGCTVSIGGGWILFEISGQGCRYLEDRERLDALIKATAPRVTRVDIATDILTDANPIAFAEQRDENRTRSISKIESPDGTTVYLGSRSSNRHVKIYRYNAPHPRAALLRIEYTYRQEDAKTVAMMIVEGATIASLAQASASRYGWLHEAYQPDPEENGEDLPAYRKAREAGKTVYWIFEQVVPAIRKLREEGLLDLDDLINAITAP
ncbi:hypothetical protein PZC41_14200 [Staphylococcus aureus]|uniref:hypothetical protein n=1 Tax=Staphylococcus aureus TaxID=1280 RepID=UPI0023B1067E|nr:hypothetical protein [Staphylococcus aureus]MDE8535456.1 hypothetical protein [Staphylococcus aureus]